MKNLYGDVAKAKWVAGAEYPPFNKIPTLTSDLFETLLPSEEVIDRQNPSEMGLDVESPAMWNGIIQTSGIVIGSQGSGKSSFGNRLALEALVKYGADKVQCLKTDKNIRNLEGYFREALVHIVLVDDITYSKQTREDMELFFAIRHRIRSETGMNLGLAIVLASAHMYYGIPKPYRNHTALQVFKDVPTNPYHYMDMVKTIGSNAVRFLERIRDNRIEYPLIKGWSIVRLYGSVFKHYAKFIDDSVWEVV